MKRSSNTQRIYPSAVCCWMQLICCKLDALEVVKLRNSGLLTHWPVFVLLYYIATASGVALNQKCNYCIGH